jgi:hypothetical protein
VDPEDPRDVISAHLKCVAGTAGRFGGAPESNENQRGRRPRRLFVFDDEAFRVLALGALKCPPIVIRPIGYNTRE